MNLGSPSMLLLGLIVAFVALVVSLAGWRHRVVLRRVFAAPILERVLPESVRRRRTIRDVAKLFALSAIVVALAEPRFDKQIRTLTAKGADILLLVDLSRSMDARDVDPSRLERARREVADLARIIEGDRVGLVVFSGGAYLRLPLTADLVALQNVLAVAGTDTFQAQGSALGVAIDEGVEALTRSKGQAGQALLVLSDGEIHDADGAREAAKRAADAGVAIYAMGIGVEPSPIPLPDGTFLMDGGQKVLTAPDFTVLKEVSEMTGGAFVQSVASTRDIEGLYRGEIRRKLQVVERQSTQREAWRAAFPWPLGAALLMWLFAAWLGDGRRAFGAAGAFLLAMSLSAPNDASAATLADADAAYRAGKHELAAEQFRELSLDQPTNPDVFDRLGAARYRAGDFEGAARAWDESSRLRGGDADALFNSGNAHHRAGRLEEALKRYDEVLAIDPASSRATKNKELTQQAIEMRRQKPPPKEGGGESEPQDGGEGEQPEPQEGSGDQPQQEGEQPPSDPQQGEGEPNDGQAEGEPQDPTKPPAPGQASEPTDGEPTDQPPGEAPAGAGGDLGEDAGPITEGQAERMLDAVEEGTQRVYVRGRPEDKPW
jgi:Ca-activated chloride channel family protein